MNRLLLIICEGTSDKVTLYKSTSNYIREKEILVKPYVTHGDIALKEDATKTSCFKSIVEIIKSFKRNYSLYPKDFFGVFHIIDTDGAFVGDEDYVLTKDGYFFDEEEGLIYSNDIERSKEINIKKKEIYKYLTSLKKIDNVDYKVLFFSRNLEHALYNKPNCNEEEKIKLSNEFEETYENDANGFYKIIKEKSFNVPLTYDESWNYIMEKSNSIRRGENYIILLNMLKEYNSTNK